MVGLKEPESVEGLRLDREIDPSELKALLLPRAAARRIGQWLHAHGDLAALAVIAVVFAVQLGATRDRSLDPDEALIFDFVNLPGPIEVYQRARTGTAHPPLFFLVLHFWRLFGRSEPFLRLLPEICGAGFLWLVYRWAGRAFGWAAGFLTLVVLALSPAWLPLSAEVRHYSLMLLLSAAALAGLEKAVEERSRGKMFLSSVFLYLAILTHYSAIFITVSLAAYGLIRLRASRAPRELLSVWAGCQAGVAALYASLYFSQIRSLRGSAMEERAMTSWLRPGYFQADRENPFWFAARQTRELFRFFFGSTPVAAVALILAAAGVVSLARKRHPAAVLFTSPYLLGAAAGLIGAYPFSETRHSVYLLPFLAASIGVALSSLLAARRRAAALAVAVLVALCWTPPVWATPPHSLAQMNEAVDQLRRRAESGSLLFADHRTGTVLSYYLGRDAPRNQRTGLADFRERDAGQYCLVDSPVWAPGPRVFGDELERMIRVYRLPAGQRLWVLRLGSEYDPAAVLSVRLPNSVFPTSLRFGDLSIIEVWLEGEPGVGVPRSFLPDPIRGQRGVAARAVVGAGQ